MAYTVPVIKLRTWQVEALFVWSALLLTVTVFGHGRRSEWVGALGVGLSFLHAQVSDRMAEEQGALAVPSVHCYKWSQRYFYLKEFCWFLYFVELRAYSALVGVVLFLAYPKWRAFWRRHYPRA